MNKEFKVEWVSKDYINSIAKKFLKEHNPQNTIPVLIEQIIEFDLGIDIIPIPGLKDDFNDAGFDIDAFISSDLKSITVDQYILDKRLPRYRFTLAHEIAHSLLHSDIYQQFEFDNTKDWISTLTNIQSIESLKKARDMAEWQADELAGRILVPKTALKEEFDKEKDITIKTYSKDHPDFVAYSNVVDYLDFIIDITIRVLSQRFVVSENTIRIRLENDGLIERHR